jgi:hypothetical protein
MNQPVDLLQALEHEPELALLVSQPPIAFHRTFVDITHSALAALLLSAYLEQKENALSPDGWFEVNAAELEYRTGLSRREQITARKTLLDKQMIQERKCAFPARLEMRIDFDRVSHEILLAARKRTQRSAAPASFSPGSSPSSMATQWARAH